ncbi:MAG: SCO family protein [Gammaproteobacteria bacterium]|nr:SCO family protein [Gammaproteobacteria bacterium]
MHWRVVLTILFFVVGDYLATAEPAAAETTGSIQQFQYDTALRASQEAIGRTLDDVPLTDHMGRSLRLSDLWGKPLVLSLVYTSCYHICPMTTRHLNSVVQKAREALGDDSFSVAILGFDAQNDSPQSMGYYARKQGIAGQGWSILSADSETVNRLSKQLGFLFFASPNGFDHIVQATVIDRDGKVYRQVYGEIFDTPLLVEPLKELVLNRPKPGQSALDELISKVRFFCTTYDPSRDGYRFDYSLFIGIAIGGLIILAGIAFVIKELYQGRKLRRI